MKILNNFIESVGADKFLHFAFGGWIVQLFTLYGMMAGGYGILFTLFVSILKEVVLDKDSGPDAWDIVAAILGSCSAMFLYVLTTLF